MSLRTLRRVAVVLTAFSTICSVAAQTPLKVGTVDVARIVKEHPKMKEAETKFNEAGKAAKGELEKRAEAYKKLVDETNKLSEQAEAPALSATAKAAKTKERDDKIAAIRTMEREMNEFGATREQQLQQQVLAFRETVLKEITDVVMERVKANNFDLVIDKSGPGVSGFSPLLFSRESADFTAEVIAAVQKGGAAPASPKPTKQ